MSGIGISVDDWQISNESNNNHSNASTPQPEYDIPEYWGKYYASQTSGAINRAKWDDYKARFQPYEDQLFKYTGKQGEKILNKDIESARMGVNQAYQGADTAQQVTMGRYGIDVSQSQKSSNALKKAAAMAQATNQARENHYQRELEVLSGGIGTSSQGVRNV